MLRRGVSPGRTTALMLGAAFVVVVVTAAAVGLVLLLATSEGVAGRADGPLASWAARQSTGWATEAMRAISRLGGTAAVVGLSAVVALVEYRRTPILGIPILLALTVGGQFALVHAIKALIGRARPEILQLTGFAGASFPSGHAAAAAASFACFAMLLARGRSHPVRAALKGGATGVAFIVAATRVALGVHWFTDVVAGLILGWGWFALCSVAVGGRALRFGEPVALGERLVGEEER